MSKDGWLSGWKNIAGHLDISIRTAIRWAEEGMPVVRKCRGGVVSARKSDLDEWRKAQPGYAKLSH